MEITISALGKNGGCRSHGPIAPTGRHRTYLIGGLTIHVKKDYLAKKGGR
jgi:hypothetical protein